MKWFRRALPLILFWAAITAYYVFVVSAGRWTSWPTWSSLYDGQAEGFRAGHLYLREPASAKLKSLADPLDPANMRYWRWDHTYYGGHLYLYWGLAPALLLAGIKTVFRIRGAITDDLLVFAFAIVRLVAGTLLLRALARRLPVRPPGWSVWLAVLVFALANPLPFVLNRGAIYEAAILGGVAFMCLGLYFAQAAIFSPDDRGSTPWLVLASLSFGLAAGSRVSLIPSAVALSMLMPLARWRTAAERRPHPAPRTVLAAGAPAAAVIATHFVLNHLRFGAWSEFGSRYQMGWPRLKMGTQYLVADVYTYLFSPPTFACRFPFVSAVWRTTRAMAPGWLAWPDDHQTHEPTAGLFIAAPFTLLGVLGASVLLTVWILWRPRPPSQTDARAWRWLWVALLLYLVGGGLPLLFVFATSMRYELDLSSGLLLISSLVGWHLLALPKGRPGRAAVATVYVVLAAATIVAGLLLGFGGYFNHFGRHNPALHRGLVEALSFCGSP